jgi:hypothetical protein
VPKNVKTPEIQKTAGVLTLRLDSLEFYYVLGLSPFGTLDHLELHVLVFRQGAETLTLNGAVMDEYVRTAFPGDEAKAFGVIKPLYFTCFFHFKTSNKWCKIFPLKKQGAKQSVKKKSART